MFYEFHTVPTRDVAGVIICESRRFLINDDAIAGVDPPPSDGPDCGSVVAMLDGKPPIRVTETYDEIKIALGIKYIGAPVFTPADPGF